MIIIGILSLQGAIEEHEKSIRLAAQDLKLNVETRRVITPEEIDEVDGLILPGGESTAMTLIGQKNGMIDLLLQKLDNGLPAFGTCAGAILLAKKTYKSIESSPKEGVFPLLDISILRNGYGRQRESFSTELILKNENLSFPGIFIRAPVIKDVNNKVEVLSSIKDDAVFIRQNNILATTFHPELTEDLRIHKLFLQIIQSYKKSKNE